MVRLFFPTTIPVRLLTFSRAIRSYQVVYDNSNEEDELVLLTAPLSSTTEIEALYTAGLIDIDSALPAALHSLGASAVEIEGALKRRRELDKNKRELHVRLRFKALRAPSKMTDAGTPRAAAM